MDLTQIHDLIIQLFSLLEKKQTRSLDEGDVSADTFFFVFAIGSFRRTSTPLQTHLVQP